MPGIDVLNTVTRMPDKSGGMILAYIVFAISATVFAGISAYAVYDMCRDNLIGGDEWISIVVLVLIFCGCCVGDFFLIKALVNETHAQETIVYATIDDSVTWNDMNSMYEVIGQDGKIYQLRLKEEEK